MIIEEGIVEKVLEDFRKRQNERKPFEASWQLSMNFLIGNQYCNIGYNSDVEEYEKQFFWQEREVYNHIAPTVEIRLAKLQRVKPIMTVVPASGDDEDIRTAKVSKKIINTIYNKREMNALISEATKWSEICGTSFYKVAWNVNKGSKIKSGESHLKMGDVEVSVCNPFEIFPDSSCSETLKDCQSIIHAKAYHVDVVKNIYNIDVKGEDINIFSLDNSASSLGGLGYSSSNARVINSTKSNFATVIEKYEKPSKQYPNGRLIIIAGNTLVHYGELPFINGVDGEREFPFIRQICIEQNGCFWGTGIVERLIPVQRAFNAVKNRKHEFMNRIAMGVLTVEDGSVDLDNLEEDGLSPGKVLVYRQGSTPPRFLSAGQVPSDFSIEEQSLLSEFMLISGVSDLLRSSNVYNNMSGIALQLLIEQDDSRIAPTADRIKDAIKGVAEQILRLYKQFVTVPRLMKIIGNNNDIDAFYFNGSDISSDDIIFETDHEFTETLAQRRSMVFELLNAGLLSDDNGKLSNRMRAKALDLLGFGIWENAQDINELHRKKASNENLNFCKNLNPKIKEIDSHDIHISEHIAFMLGNEFEKACETDDKLEAKLTNHIKAHKQYLSLENQLKQGE